ncbi:MAG TPA: hypothetical protein VJV74_05315 [Terriglobia bacterium]|nr:hypothetical protein [Terriglobia bacterium]
MDDERFRQELSSNPSPPDPPPSNRGLWAVVVVLLCAVAIAIGYSVHEHQQAQQMASSQDQMSTALSQTRNQVDALSTQLSDVNSRLAASQQAAQEQAARSESARSTGAVRHTRRAAVRREDPRFKKMQAQLDDEQKQIAATQDNVDKARTEFAGNLSSTRDELNGSIAKNHDELVALEKRGERNYYEFDLNKSKHFQHVGPVSISLRKTSTKHDHFNLVMLVDDREVSRKNINLYEPMLFYPPDSAQPLEVVANEISKDHIHGYVSAPKYRKSELEKAASTSNTGATPAATASPSSNSNGAGSNSGSSDANGGGISSTTPASGSDTLTTRAAAGPQL